MEQVRITEVVAFDKCAVESVNYLVNQLVSTPMEFTDQSLHEMLAYPNSQLFFIYVDERVAGMLTLGHYMSPTGVKYWVEDVVVDEAYRGKALGRKLIDFAIEYVKQKGKATLMLTSKPVRVAANKLYQSAGFQSKQTNVYKMDFEDEAIPTSVHDNK